MLFVEEEIGKEEAEVRWRDMETSRWEMYAVRLHDVG